MRIPEIQAYIQEKADVSVSESTVSRYGKRLADSYRDLMIAQESFESLRKEVENTRSRTQRGGFAAYCNPQDDGGADQQDGRRLERDARGRLMREISGVTRAVAYKQRVDMQNK